MLTRAKLHRAAHLWLAVNMIGIGVAHFVLPDFFVAIMPPQLPLHLELVVISGFFEIAGGVGLLIPKTRTLAAYGCIALYLAVYPANLHMAFNEVTQPMPGGPIAPVWVLWARLPLQFVFIAWAWWVRRPLDEPTPA